MSWFGECLYVGEEEEWGIPLLFKRQNSWQGCLIVQDFVLPCYPTSRRKIQPVVAIALPISSPWKVQRNFAFNCCSVRSAVLLGLFQHSSDSCYSCKFFYSMAGIFPDSQCSDWHHDPVSKEKKLLRHLFQPGLHITSNLSLTLPRCRESLIFWKKTPLAAPSAQIPCWNEPQVKNKVIPGKESKAGTNWNTRSERADVTDVIPNTVSFQLHILSSSTDSCSQLLLLETVKRCYSKKIYLEKGIGFLSPLFLSHNVHALKDYHQNSHSHFHPISIKPSLKNGHFVIHCFSEKQEQQSLTYNTSKIHICTRNTIHPSWLAIILQYCKYWNTLKFGTTSIC